MVPALLYLLLKKLRHQNWGKMRRNFVSRLFIARNRIIIALVVILLLISFVLAAQEQNLSYKIIRKGDEIGWVNLVKKTDNNNTIITMQSEVEVTFIFTFSSVAKEVSEFRNGKLNHSYFFRKRNGDVKADRHTHLTSNGYEVESKSEKKKLNILPVTFNTLCMYFEEPVNLKKVYSDNYQCLLDIDKKPDGAYQVTGTDGNITSFYYRDGRCYKVKLDYNFYSATLILK
jgi:hypothetical protein